MTPIGWIKGVFGLDKGIGIRIKTWGMRMSLSKGNSTHLTKHLAFLNNTNQLMLLSPPQHQSQLENFFHLETQQNKREGIFFYSTSILFTFPCY